MTIREVLARRRTICFIVAFAAWLGGAASISFSTSQYDPGWLYAFFIIIFGGALIAIMRLRCPRCSGSLAFTSIRLTGKSKGLSRRIDFCPYCGVSLDQPYDAPM